MRLLPDYAREYGYCTVADGSAWLEIPEGTIRRWMHEGRVSSFRAEGLVFINVADLANAELATARADTRQRRGPVPAPLAV